MTEMKPNAITARFDRVEYDALNAREKEAFNLARLGAGDVRSDLSAMKR